MPKATLLYRSKLVYSDRSVREMVIWRLPKPTLDRSHGLKYRLYYGTAEGKCLVRYDNETGKGDHRHMNARETLYTFSSVEQLVTDFQHDINRIREKR